MFYINAQNQSSSLPFDRLTIFSKKVFWGATSPLRPPAILPLHSIVCRWIFTSQSAVFLHGLWGSETLRGFLRKEELSVWCGLYASPPPSPPALRCAAVRCGALALLYAPHHPEGETTAGKGAGGADWSSIRSRIWSSICCTKLCVLQRWKSRVGWVMWEIE